MNPSLEFKILDFWKDEKDKVNILYSVNDEVRLNEEKEEKKKSN